MNPFYKINIIIDELEYIISFYKGIYLNWHLTAHLKNNKELVLIAFIKITEEKVIIDCGKYIISEQLNKELGRIVNLLAYI